MFGKLFKRQWPYCLVSDSLSLSTRGWPKGRYLRLWSKSRYKKPRIKKKTTLEKKILTFFLPRLRFPYQKKKILSESNTRRKNVGPQKPFVFFFLFLFLLARFSSWKKNIFGGCVLMAPPQTFPLYINGAARVQGYSTFFSFFSLFLRRLLLLPVSH